MALTFLPGALVIESDSSIPDLPAFHAALRDWEDSAEAAVHPVTHTWKAVDLGGGAFFYALDLVNGWRLRFPVPGSYVIQGNLGGEILPVAGVYVERKTSAAYATTAVGGNGPSAADIAVAVRGVLNAELVRIVELAKVHGLVESSPLVVTPTSRSAGDVAQTISQVGETVTVERAG
jgi:hypothetical protein